MVDLLHVRYDLVDEDLRRVNALIQCGTDLDPLSICIERIIGDSLHDVHQETNRISLLLDWSKGHFGDVPDPYRCPRRVFEQVHASIERGVGRWLRYL